MTWKRKHWILLSVVLLVFLVLASAGAVGIFLLVGSQPPSLLQATGTYRCVYPYAIEALTLDKDGTYKQSITLNSGEQLTNNGRWSLHAGDALDGQIELASAIVIDSGLGKPRKEPRRANWIMPISRRLRDGEIFIRVNEDLDLYFFKVDR